MDHQALRTALLKVVSDGQGDWIKRNQIAKQFKKKRLNQYEIALLDTMVGEGMIESRQRENATPIGFHWEYRVRLSSNVE
jgi:hypothetical protein